MPRDSILAVAAYQRLGILELRKLYDQIDVDLKHYSDIESHVENGASLLEEDFDQVRNTLLSLGAEIPAPTENTPRNHSRHPRAAKNKYKKISIENPGDFGGLARQARGHLAELGVDLRKDPLLQILDSGEISETTGSYKKKYGDITWDESDQLVVMLAGMVATLLDILLVRIPTDPTRRDGIPEFLGEKQKDSPLTRWLRDNSEHVHENYLRQFEKRAKVPYDDTMERLTGVEGLSPKVHRLMSLGHDPILGFIFGVSDIMRGTGTFIDKHGDMIVIDKVPNQTGLIEAFLKVFFHLLSDVCTSSGIQPPFFTLLQLVKAKSPFILGSSGEKVSWTDVARYMYTHGYDLRHFATMGIVPASVEMIVRGWWLCRSFENREEAELARVKMTSMLMLGHTIATSGNLLKTGVIFGMNPLALNWAEILALFPVTINWIRGSAKRDHAIRRNLDAEWLNIYHDSSSKAFVRP